MENRQRLNISGVIEVVSFDEENIIVDDNNFNAFQDVLKQVLADNGFQVGKILQGPMEGLKEYHKKDVVPTM